MNINKTGWLAVILAVLGLNFAIANPDATKLEKEQSVNGTADHEFEPPPPPPKP